jgi:O-antigen ligase
VFAVDSAFEALRPADSANGKISPFRYALAAAGMAAAAGAIFLAGSRAIWPCVIAIPALFVLTGERLSARAMALTGAALLAAVMVAAGPASTRIKAAYNDIAAARSGDYATPLGKRLVIWHVGVQAAREKPLLGHGPDAPFRLMAERTAAISGVTVRYSHFHNFLLTEWVRAGIIGVAALIAMFVTPIVAVWKARKDDPIAFTGFRLLAGCQIAFLASGSFNILFGHDIIDALFVAVNAFCLYLAFGGKPQAA